MKRGHKFVVAAAAAIAALLLADSPLHLAAAASTPEEASEDPAAAEGGPHGDEEVEAGEEALGGVDPEEFAEDADAAGARDEDGGESSPLEAAADDAGEPLEIGAGVNPSETQQAQPQGDVGAEGVEDVEADPRLGRCTAEELSDMARHFSDGTACPAYRCIDTETAHYTEAIKDKYGSRYDADEVASLAGMMAACHCRCPVMKCEIDYVTASGSASCREATVDFCRQSNEKFTEKCTAVAGQLPLVYDLEKDPQAFKSYCQVCE